MILMQYQEFDRRGAVRVQAEREAAGDQMSYGFSMVYSAGTMRQG